MKLHKALRAFDSDALASKALEDDIREELQAHLELSTAAGIERGLSQEEAQHHALEQFGNFERTLSACTRAKRGALHMKHLHLILTVALILACGGMVAMAFASRAQAAQREAAVMELHARLEHQQTMVAEMAKANTPGLIRVRIGDELELVGTYNPGEWTEHYPVERDGTVLLPNLGHVEVLGLSRADLEKRLMELYTPIYARLDLYVRVHQKDDLPPQAEETQQNE